MVLRAFRLGCRTQVMIRQRPSAFCLSAISKHGWHRLAFEKCGCNQCMVIYGPNSGILVGEGARNDHQGPSGGIKMCLAMTNMLQVLITAHRWVFHSQAMKLYVLDRLLQVSRDQCRVNPAHLHPNLNQGPVQFLIPILSKYQKTAPAKTLLP